LQACEVEDLIIFAQFCKEYGGMPLLHGPVETLYADLTTMFTTIMAKFEIPPVDTSVKSKDIQIKSNLKVRIYHPPEATGYDPLGVYYHGGGWVLCDLESEDAICRLISKALNMVIVSVDYRLAPKHKYPAALDDCTDAYLWAVANAAELGTRNTKIAIIGGSAGGNLAIGSALKLTDEGKGDGIGGVVALVPVTVHPDAVPADLKGKYTSYEENAELTLNTKSAMLEFWSEIAIPAYVHDRKKLISARRVRSTKR
jgi:versiconal hemiacetal acetate esterase